MGKRVVCIGVWDLFHFGHLRLIQRAASLGDLSVAVVADAAIKVQKGEDRPIIPQWERLAIVSALRPVVRAFLVPAFAVTQEMVDEHDVVVIGEDQRHIRDKHLVPTEKLHLLTRSPGVSTSEIVAKIKGGTQ
jgi:choline-phosphate cytidylyltransferase